MFCWQTSGQDRRTRREKKKSEKDGRLVRASMTQADEGVEGIGE